MSRKKDIEIDQKDTNETTNGEFEQLEMQLMDNSTYVYKSHNLIESGYNFTLNEQRLTYLAAKKLKPRFIKSKIKPSQITTLLGNVTFKNLRIYVNEFKDEFKLSSNNLYSILSDTASSLQDKKIQYLQDDGVFVKKSWVITSKYNEKEKYVELTFHPDLILDLLVFKGRFGKLQFDATKSFKSSYAFRIYELLQNYAYKGFREIYLEELRYKLGIYDDSKHKRFTDFNRYVLEPSVKTINENADIHVEYEPKRMGRKVGKIYFTITKKVGVELDVGSGEIIEQSQVENMNKILKHELTAGQVAEITNSALEAIKNHKIDMSFYEYIKRQAKVVEQYGQNKTIKSYFGVLKTAIEGYWDLNEEITPTNSFNNFEGRQYNHGALEEMLVGDAEYDETKIYNEQYK